MNRVRYLRKERGLTQQKLSLDLHVSQQYISKVENGATMTEDIILRMSKYFHVSIAYLLGVNDDRNSEEMQGNEDPELEKWVDYYYDLTMENQNTVSALSQYLIKTQKEKE